MYGMIKQDSPHILRKHSTYRKNMPDISMCKNKTCKVRKKCYRYMATPTPQWQAYADFDQQRDSCFVPMNKEEVHRAEVFRKR